MFLQIKYVNYVETKQKNSQPTTRQSERKPLIKLGCAEQTNHRTLIHEKVMKMEYNIYNHAIFCKKASKYGQEHRSQTLQTNPRYHEKESQNTDCQKTSGRQLKQRNHLYLFSINMIAKLDGPNTEPNKQWEQQ